MAFAQEKVSITGKVTDKQNNPVAYASVTYSHPTNKLLSDATLTDENRSVQSTGCSRSLYGGY